VVGGSQPTSRNNPEKRRSQTTRRKTEISHTHIYICEYTHLVGTVGHQAAVDLRVFEILVLLAVPSDGLGAARQQTYECRFTRSRLQQIVHIQRYDVLASLKKKEHILNFLM